MKNEEWTISDLERELISQGISLWNIPFINIYDQLRCNTVKEAVRNIVEGLE